MRKGNSTVVLNIRKEIQKMNNKKLHYVTKIVQLNMERNDISIFNEITECLFPLLKAFFTKHNVKNDHNHVHALAIASHALRACEADKSLNETQIRCIILTAFLHDVDDHKLFSSIDYENARVILNSTKYCGDMDNIIEMIDLVGSSKHGDRMYGKEEWKFIPRYSDRLDAIGMMGIARTIVYTLDHSQSLYCDDTPRPRNLDELYEVATKERYKSYNGNSKSMIDHCFDKMIHLGNFPIKNTYLNELSKTLTKDVIDMVLLFGNQGGITIDELKLFIKTRSPEVYLQMEICKY